MKKANTFCYRFFSGRFLGVIISLMLLFSCAAYKIPKDFDPDSREFLSKVRYIITKQEHKIFLNLPPSEREKFIGEFWQKRDPDPYTEENEFKEQYYNRIEEANMLFREGGTPGWLQDRGRIYILLGPPDQRNVYPRGYTFYGKPMEIWYYGFFPVIFIDRSWNGDYKLIPQSAFHISEMNKAQMERKPQVEDKDVVFDFDLDVKKVKEGEVLIQVKIPYKNIWFKETKEKLETTLEVLLNILDSSDKEVASFEKSYTLSLDLDQLYEAIKRDYIIEIPVKLPPGQYLTHIELENKTDENRIRKTIRLTI